MIRGFLETSEVATMLGISSVAVLKLAHRGTLKSNFLAGRRLYEVADVNKLLADPLYTIRSRKGSQPVKDTVTPSLFGEASREPGSAESSQTASRDDDSDLKAKDN